MHRGAWPSPAVDPPLRALSTAGPPPRSSSAPETLAAAIVSVDAERKLEELWKLSCCNIFTSIPSPKLSEILQSPFNRVSVYASKGNIPHQIPLMLMSCHALDPASLSFAFGDDLGGVCSGLCTYVANVIKAKPRDTRGASTLWILCAAFHDQAARSSYGIDEKL
eukprot:m51a1_g10903 hypothetical protein (165) ;mRNA; f:38017-39296